MRNSQAISGYRLDSRNTQKPKRLKEYDYLHPKKNTVEALNALQDAVDEDNHKLIPERNCYENDARYSNYDDPRNHYTIPTDSQARRMCEGCPLFELCKTYAETARPAWGVWAGKVYGKELPND